MLSREFIAAEGPCLGLAPARFSRLHPMVQFVSSSLAAPPCIRESICSPPGPCQRISLSRACSTDKCSTLPAVATSDTTAHDARRESSLLASPVSRNRSTEAAVPGRNLRPPPAHYDPTRVSAYELIPCRRLSLRNPDATWAPLATKVAASPAAEPRQSPRTRLHAHSGDGVSAEAWTFSLAVHRRRDPVAVGSRQNSRETEWPRSIRTRIHRTSDSKILLCGLHAHHQGQPPEPERGGLSPPLTHAAASETDRPARRTHRHTAPDTR